VRRTITIAQLATSMALLVGAGLLVRSSLPGTAPISPGFDPRDTLTLRLDTPATLAADPARRAAALAMALERVRAVPGVRAAALGSPDAWLGLGPQDKVTTFCRECSLANVWTPILVGPARNLAVSPGWFGALGVRVLKGREITEADRGRRVAVINQAFAGRLFPSRWGSRCRPRASGAPPTPWWAWWTTWRPPARAPRRPARPRCTSPRRHTRPPPPPWPCAPPATPCALPPP
jgi:putative ABC transport system permease protein